MEFIIAHAGTGDKNYFNEKINAFLNLPEGQEAPALLKSVKAAAALPVIAAKENFFEINAEQRKQIEIAQRCALQEVAERAPLAKDEVVEEDFFCYLLEPYEDLPAYTAVLRRSTNMATFIYFFPMVRIDKGDIVHIAPPAPDAIDKPLLKWTDEYITGALIKKMLIAGGKSAASAAASKLGTIILGIVMKEVFGVDDTQRMIDEVRKVVKDEIEANEIDLIQGVINGTLQFLANEYNPQRAKANLSDATVRARLLGDLKKYSNQFYTDVIGTLRLERYAQRGLKTFMFAASVHLLLTQEMALIDPEYMDPNESGFLETLRKNAASYKSHVYTTFTNAINRRNNMEVVWEKRHMDTGTRFQTVDVWYWRDNFTGKSYYGYTSSKNPDRTAKENATIAMENHRKEVLNQLTIDLGRPQETFLDHIDGFVNFSFPKLPAPKVEGLNIDKTTA